jgi:hypothetical protein
MSNTSSRSVAEIRE